MEIVISEIIYEASTDDTDKKAGVEVTQMDEEFADMDKELYTTEEAYEMTMKDVKAIYDDATI